MYVHHPFMTSGTLKQNHDHECLILYHFVYVTKDILKLFIKVFTFVV